MYKTVVNSNAEALQAISALYLKGDLHLDVCFRDGAFYKNAGIFPEIKQDIKPLFPDVLKIDVTKMYHPHNSVRSIMFDPPWLVSSTVNKVEGRAGKLDIMNKHAREYGAFSSTDAMFSFQSAALQQMARCLIPGGWLIAKGQDCIYGRQKFFLSIWQPIAARPLGLDLIDSFVLIAKNRYRQPGAGTHSAISAHCFFHVYRKAVRAKRIIRY